MAREFGAIFKLNFQHQEARQKFNVKSETELPLTVEVKDKENCRRFSAVSLANVQIQPSPLWLQIALSYAGVRPINNVVDITNYVMLDIGQPMHAFDYTKVAEHKLVVRKAFAKEKLTTLDGKDRDLDDSITVVADSTSAQSVAGIMGGAAAEIVDDSTEMILEAASWEMYQIRRASRALGLRSEASTRYEKGLSASTTVDALMQAANMLADLASAEVACELVDVDPQPEEEKIIRFNPKLISRRLGVKVTKQEFLDIITPLGIELINPEQIAADIFSQADEDTEIELLVPLHRRDLTIPADILEEVARFYGYEYVEPTLPKRDLTPAQVNQEMRTRRQLSRLLAAAGLYEIITYSMVGDELYQKTLLTSRGLLDIQSPISPELACVRDTLVPSLLEKAQINHQKYQNFGLFEMSRVALNHTDPETELPRQPHKLGMVFVHQSDELAYRHLKNGLETVNKFTKDAVEAKSGSDNLPPFLHPGKSGDMLLGGKYIGFVGVVHPMVVENFGFSGVSVAVAELDLDLITNYQPETVAFKPISRFPAVIRDLSFWQKPDSSVSDLLAEVRQAKLEWLESVSIIDTFSKEDKTSVAIRLTLQPTEQTLTHEEIDGVVEQVKQIATKLGHTPREK
ncbi:phenylalanine--tRNA ligase subunit beta, partial [Candidatus Dojkabacteria bacterium]|nr:phenylalanine--tRNA ligase subunit beta [Candidatus Dojkabacteria bacterium]